MGTNNFADAVEAWLMALIQAAILVGGETCPPAWKAVRDDGKSYNGFLDMEVGGFCDNWPYGRQISGQLAIEDVLALG